MKKSQSLFYALIFLAGLFIFSTCTQSKKEEHAASEEHEHPDMMKEEGNHETGEEHGSESEEGHHDHEASGTTGESKMWIPSGNGVELIKSDFHFLTGATENIKPEVIQGQDGENILELTANGIPTAFVFHDKYGNVGLTASIKRDDFKGTLKLIHHAKNVTDYEFVSINANKMKLGRVENGQEKVFDEGDFSTNSTDWMLLKGSAAGSHYKGYIGDKTITHGHGDEMESGFVGLMIEGTGKIQVKSIEVVKLEEE